MKRDHFSVRIVVDSKSCTSSAAGVISEAVRRAFAGTRGYFEVKVCNPGERPYKVALDAIKNGFTGVGICGDDTAVKEVAAAFLNKDAVLGVVPAGVRNVIAAGLGVPTGIESALRLIKPGPSCVKKIDVGVLSGRHFFTSAGIGMDVELSARFTSERAAKAKKFSLSRFSRTKEKPGSGGVEDTINISSNGDRITLTPLMVRFANVSCYGSTVIAAGAEPSDGLLNTCIVPMPDSRLTGGGGIEQKLLSREISSIPGYSLLLSKGPIEVSRSSTGPIHVDGEVFEGDKDFKVVLLPSALKVWA
ncbi:MAG: diacylglycerol kinase family protein [Thermodesulfobacteriota bacterium]